MTITAAFGGFSDGYQEVRVMQASYATMQEWSRQVDAALSESTSVNTRRLMHHVHGVA